MMTLNIRAMFNEPESTAFCILFRISKERRPKIFFISASRSWDQPPSTSMITFLVERSCSQGNALLVPSAEVHTSPSSQPLFSHGCQPKDNSFLPAALSFLCGQQCAHLPCWHVRQCAQRRLGHPRKLARE